MEMKSTVSWVLLRVVWFISVSDKLSASIFGVEKCFLRLSWLQQDPLNLWHLSNKATRNHIEEDSKGKVKLSLCYTN
jgi:hypothetical protein